MKRTILLTALLCTSLFTFAQLKFGVKAGANISRTSDVESKDLDDTISYTNSASTKYGLHFGGYANYKFTKYVGAQGELLFSMLGSKPEAKNRNVYISIPIMVDVQPFQAAPFSIMAGPQVSVTPFYQKDSGQDFASYFDFSVVLGAQYTFFNHLALSARYCHGFTNSVDNEVARWSYQGGKNRVLQLSLGWTF